MLIGYFADGKMMVVVCIQVKNAVCGFFYVTVTNFMIRTVDRGKRARYMFAACVGCDKKLRSKLSLIRLEKLAVGYYYMLPI